MQRRRRRLGLVKALLMSHDLTIEPVTSDDAELAARRWRRSHGLSLATRLRQALAEHLTADIITNDTEWGSAGRIRQIR